MRSAYIWFSALALICTALLFQACSKSDSGSTSSSGGGSGDTYISVENDALTFEFKSGGVVHMVMKDVGESQGTYTIDGEKMIVNIDGQQHTFIRDGDCIEEPRQIFGKLCKGGKDAAGNASTRTIPTTPGTWVATNEDGEFKLEFKTGNKLTLTVTQPGGKAQSQDGKFEVEGTKVHVTLSDYTPMVLLFVNDAFESNAFGLPMKFVKQ